MEVHGTNESKKVDVEQYGRRLNLENAGVSEKDGENTSDIVVKDAKLAKAEITLDQICTSHRLAAKRNAIDQAAQSSPIVVRFISRDIRKRLFANRQNFCNVNLKHFSTDGTNYFYINENLTRCRKKIIPECKSTGQISSIRILYLGF